MLSIQMLLIGLTMFTPTLFGSTSVYNKSLEKQDYLSTTFYSTSSLLETNGKQAMLLENESYNNMQEETAMEQATAPRRVRPAHWDDPSPIGDIPWVVMALLLLGYGIGKYKHRQKC